MSNLAVFNDLSPVECSPDVPRESCTDSAALDKVVAFNRTCYELHLNEGNAFAKARNYCTKQNGDLWHHINKNALELISRELERKKHTMKVTATLASNNFHLSVIWHSFNEIRY
jgi:hypothetical protein